MKNIISAFKKILFDNKCSVCGIVLDDNENYLCYNCQKHFKVQSLKKYENMYYIWDYDEYFKKVIYSYKFEGQKELSLYLGNLIEKKLDFIIKNEKIDLIIPVPVHIKRKNERGFNQTEQILKVINKEFLEIKRIKNTEHMYKILDKQKRYKNIRNSFDVDNKLFVEGKKVLIFDDIITTGSTMDAVSNEIKKAGATEVIGFVLAAAPFYKKRIIKN